MKKITLAAAALIFSFTALVAEDKVMIEKQYLNVMEETGKGVVVVDYIALAKQTRAYKTIKEKLVALEPIAKEILVSWGVAATKGNIYALSRAIIKLNEKQEIKEFW